MTFRHGKDSRLLLAEVPFSGFIRSWEHSSEIELADTTVLGDGGHRWIPGLENGTLTLDGLVDNDADAGGQDATLDGALGAAAGSYITAAPEGLALGRRIITIEARESKYAIASPVADAVSFNSEWKAEGRVDVGVALHDLTAQTTTSDGSNVDNTTSTANGGIGVLHVTAATGTTPTLDVKIQHSVDNSVWVDLITFTQATAATSERLTVAGTVNRHLRAIWTIAGTTPSFTFAAAFARR